MGLPNKGKLKVFRKNATTTKQTHAISGKMDFLLLRNDGANDIKINFKMDGASNYWTLKTSAQTPAPIGVEMGDTIHYEAVTGTSTLEIILWA